MFPFFFILFYPPKAVDTKKKINFALLLKQGCLSSMISSGLRCPFRRGNANNGVNAGLLYINGNVDVSNANANWSSPLYLLIRSVCYRVK